MCSNLLLPTSVCLKFLRLGMSLFLAGDSLFLLLRQRRLGRTLLGHMSERAALHTALGLAVLLGVSLVTASRACSLTSLFRFVVIAGMAHVLVATTVSAGGKII